MNKKVLAILLVTVLLVGACALALAACAETSTTVTYYVDGSVYRTITVTGTGASDPGLVPVKEGYTFAGWYLDRNFTSPFNFRDYASNENRSSISVYAYFVPVQTGGDDNDGDNSGDGGEEVITYRTVTFNVNGGDSEIQPREYQVGALMSLPVPEREGYTFIGWRDMFGDYYNAESVMPDEDITLTAVWEKKVTTFEDDYVMFAPATEGKKHDNDYYEAYRETVQTYLYVELTSDDLGGIDRVGKRNNFDLTQNVQMEFSVSSGYTLSWYEGNWNNPNGAQLFTLGYGSNIQLLTVSEGQRVVKRYLVDIYVLHDYYVSLYEDIFDTEPYDTVRVIENQRFAADTEIKQHGGFEYDCRVYWNSLLEEYVPYTYTDRVTRDISLYQTYKEKTISVIDEEGAALESVSVKPYTQYSLITAPQKQGYDFLGFRVEGEEDDNDWYFADITGNTTLNYLSLEEDIDLLTAVFAPKKYYQYVSEDGSKLHVVPTVPVVLYTNRAQRSISEIIYVAEGSTVPLPSQAPFDPMDERESFFVGWGYYKRTSGGKWLGDDFLFYKTVEKPAAVYAITDVVTGGSADYPWYGISLDSERTFSSGERIDASYRVHLPLEATYTLTVTTTGRVAFTVPAYQDQTSHNYTATSSSPATVPIYWDWGDSTGYGGGTIHFKVTSYSGSFTVKLTGPNAVNNEEYVTLDGENTIVYGQSATLIDPQNKVGYDHIFTDENNNKVTQNIEKWTYENGQTFNITDEYIALDRTIMFDSCGGSQVDAITQATDTTIQLPTPEREGYVFLGWFYEKVPAAISERVDIEVMPGVDTTLYAGWTDEQDAQYLTYTAGEEGIIITGYTGDNTIIKLPSEMFGLPVTGIGDRVFYNFTGLTSITIPDSITGIGNSAFYGCNNLKSITIPDSVTSMESYAFRGCNALTIYCEASSKPGGWSSSWNYSNCPVVWNCNNNEADINGNIYYVAENGIRYALNNGTATVIRQSTALSGEIIIPGEITYKDVAYSVTTINASAFSGCSDLTSVTIPDSVISIDSYAFYGCSGLISISIPGSVTSIGNYAFDGVNIGYTIKYILNGGTNASANPQTVDIYDFVSNNGVSVITIMDPISFGYTANADGTISYLGGNVEFLGWYKDAGFTEKVEELALNTGDITLYAKWSSPEYTVNYVRVNENNTPDQTGGYILFGQYPQTIKAEWVTVGDTADADGYYLGSDEARYAKVIADPKEKNYIFSDYSSITSGRTYYFKVEPIRWRILSESDGKVLIMCDSIIANKAYDSGSNNYANSDIRVWLNNEFYNTAFGELQQALIATTEVDNSAESTGQTINPSACENTFDKVFLPSYSEVVNSDYGFSSSPENDLVRCLQTSDYSRAIGADTVANQSQGSGLWWLRSPITDTLFARYVGDNGYAGYAGNVRSNDIGIAPALVIIM